MNISQVIEQIKNSLPGSVLKQAEFRGETHIYVKKEHFTAVMEHLCYNVDLKFNLLLDVVGVDHHPLVPRFELAYVLFSLKTKLRLIVKLKAETDEIIPSMTSCWKSANWPEREVYDLLGIKFSNHPDLRRILTWDNFKGHPLRKDFPLRGTDFDEKFDPDSIKVY